jgi:hypothetical protein
MVAISPVYGIWDSRTNNFYALSDLRFEAVSNLEEEVEDLAARGVLIEDIDIDLNHQLIETSSGQGRPVYGYTIGTARHYYQLLLVAIE